MNEASEESRGHAARMCFLTSMLRGPSGLSKHRFKDQITKNFQMVTCPGPTHLPRSQPCRGCAQPGDSAALQGLLPQPRSVLLHTQVAHQKHHIRHSSPQHLLPTFTAAAHSCLEVFCPVSLKLCHTYAEASSLFAKVPASLVLNEHARAPLAISHKDMGTSAP